MRTVAAWLLLLLACCAITGCAKKTATESAPSAAGFEAKPGAYLAYQHDVSLTLAAGTIDARLAAARDACLDGRYGACSVLTIEQGGGNGARSLLTVRIVPAGVEPLVALAADGAKIGKRETKAEDLADAVADVASKRDELSRQQARLREFQTRKDLAVGDLLTLARESASVDAQLEALARTAADQQRRLETNLLTLRFDAPYEREPRFTRIGNAFGDMLDEFVNGFVEAIEMLAFALPFLLFAFPLALVWRWSWRRVTQRSGAAPPGS